MQDRRVQLAIGAGVAILLALLLAIFVSRQGKAPAGPAQPKGELQVDAVRDEARVSQTKPLRCFVGGQYVGDMPIAACAQKNGVAAQALDVGLDPQTGQVAGGSAPLQPLPAPTSSSAPAPAPPVVERPAISTPTPTASAGPAECLRFAGGDWRSAGPAPGLNQCVRTLFDGRCVRAGDALYGRYGALTLRLVPGRVELSPDNRSFRYLLGQDEDCNLAPG